VTSIATHAVATVLMLGGNVLIDADAVDGKKRALMRTVAWALGAELVFVRVSCDMEVALCRIIAAAHPDRTDSFFSGATPEWKGEERVQGAAVKIRAMWKRTPKHYEWKDRDGGAWTLKRPPVRIHSDIDTSDPAHCERAVEDCANRIRSL